MFVPGKDLLLLCKMFADVSFYHCSYSTPEISAACKQLDAVQPLSLFLKNCPFFPGY